MNLPLWLAILITGLLFSLLHFRQPGFGLVFVVLGVALTVLLVFFRLNKGTLWLAIGLHAGWNWMEDSVIGFSSANTSPYGHALLHLKLLQPDSLVQPEQGPIGAVVILLSLAVLTLWVRRKKRELHLRARLDDEGQVQPAS
jgi:membrane protease YdiL (CAAX protease family)